MNKKAEKKFKFRLEDRTLAVIDWANVYGWFSNSKNRNYLGWGIDPKKLFDYLSTYEKIFGKRLYYGVEVGNKRSEYFGSEAEKIGFTFIKKEVKWVPVYLNEQNHFKKVIQKLFDVLDGVKNTNSEIANKLYELREKIEKSLVAYGLIEELDIELKKLNINIEELQQDLLEPARRRKCDFDVEIARDVCNLLNNFDTLILFSGDGDYAALAEDLVSKGKKIIVVFAHGHKGKEYEPLQEKLIKERKRYALFLCTVKHLREYISSMENIIPADFSAGRDANNITEIK